MSTNDANTQMLTGRIVPQFVRFVLPSVLGLLSFSSASMIDGIFIGNYVGAVALASVNLAMPLLAFVFGVLIMISLGGTVVAGEHLGRDEKNEASNVFSKTGIVLVVVMVLLSVIALLTPEGIARLVGARGNTLRLCAEYIWVVSWFFPAFGIALLFSQFARVSGAPAMAFIGIVTTTVVNIMLDYWLIAVLGWGVTGAALATGTAFAAGGFVVLFYFLSPKATLQFIRPFGSWMIIFRTAFNGFS
ncbi:MAG: MATE family efflux transporter, partial [Planktomarina sp.]